MKFKLTSLEKKWVLYDVGNSAFTMMVSTIFPGICHIRLYTAGRDPGTDSGRGGGYEKF